MCIRAGKSPDMYIPNVSIYGENVKKVVEEKYLGYIVSDNCYDNNHVIKETRNTYIRGNMLIRNFKHCSEEVKVKLFKAYCSSVYCCALISMYHKNVIKKLHVAFNKIFKCLMNVPPRSSASASFVYYNVNNFAVLRRKLAYSFVKRVQCSTNNLVSTIINLNRFASCKMKQEWDMILY